MRIAGALVVIGGLAATLTTVAAQPKPDAEAVMTAARKALGGDERLSAVKSFSLTGRTQQGRGKNSAPNELEMRCERPDRCTRTDEIPARGVRQDFMRLTLGMFAGRFPALRWHSAMGVRTKCRKARPT